MKRLPDATVFQSGVVQADAFGRVTNPAARRFSNGSRRRVNSPGPAAVGCATPAPRIGFDAAGLAAGVFLLEARQGAAIGHCRVVLIP